MGAVCPQTSNRMAEKTISQSKTPRAHRTALDRLDWGQPLQAGESLRQKISLPEGVEMVMPGDNIDMEITLITPIALEQGLRFAIREGGRTVGSGVVAKVIE